MTDSAINSHTKRIVKNTLFLYFRMLLSTLVSLYTVRVVLSTLGVGDYGIYNVVGGIVSLLSFMTSTMASASQRFFAFELGRGDYAKLKQTFSLTLQIYVGISLVILLLAETVGLWFLNTQMTIPADRMNAANWVYQFSILSFMMGIFITPYNAAIIAREHMRVYAYVSIIDVLLRLVIVYLLVLFSFDKLKLYAVLTFCTTAIIAFIYRIYCKRKFEECTFAFYWDRIRFKEIFSFAGWNMIGSVANVGKDQGLNILLNIFFNPTVNAARAIAFQINAAINSFTNNFYTAVRPQLTKSHSSGDDEYMRVLVYGSSKYGFFLLMLLAIPLLIDTEYILGLWLQTVPQHTVLFTRLVILNTLVDVFSFPIVNALQATGKIRGYQLSISTLYLMILPVSYLFLRFGYSPEITVIISIIVSLACFFPRLYYAKKYVHISIHKYLQRVILLVSGVFIFASLLPAILYLKMSPSSYRLILILVSDILFSSLVIYTLGLSKVERIAITKFIKNKHEKWFSN